MSAPPSHPRRSLDAWRREAKASQWRAQQARLEAERRARARAMARRMLAWALALGIVVAAYVLVTGAAS